jgi:hypothetical protein
MFCWIIHTWLRHDCRPLAIKEQNFVQPCAHQSTSKSHNAFFTPWYSELSCECMFIFIIIVVIIMALQPFFGLGRFFSFFILHTDCRAPWTGDQPVARSRYLHREQHKNRIHAHNTDIHALSEIRSHDPSVWADEESSCLRPRDHDDLLSVCLLFRNRNILVAMIISLL